MSLVECIGSACQMNILNDQLQGNFGCEGRTMWANSVFVGSN